MGNRLTMLRVLVYHGISRQPAGTSQYQFGVPLPQFQAQIEQLAAAGYDFVDADAALAFLCNGKALPRRAVLVTFDDCYASIAPAVKWLAAQRIRGVAFAIAGSLRPGAPIEGLTEPLLDKAGLVELRDHGCEIGAHSNTHRRLTLLTSFQRRQEIAGSIARLQEEGLGPVRMFAYPYGAYDRAVYDDTRRSGVLAAVTVDAGIVRAGDDPLRLRRIEIFASDRGTPFLHKVATGGLNPLRAVWGSVRRHAIMTRTVSGGVL